LPTLLTHPAVPLGLALGLGRKAISPRLAAVGVLASVLPDLDVLAFKLGIPYAAQFGHRGFSHSLVFALVIGVLGLALAPLLRAPRWRSFLFLSIATASHGLLDAFTNGGLGIALLWPFSDTRYFAPVQPIEVSPLGLSRFLSPRGAAVLRSEALWVWLPCLLTASLILASRRRRA
jgi:inner membrane protein